MDYLEKEYGRRLNSAVNFGLRRKGVVNGGGGKKRNAGVAPARSAVDIHITRF